MSFTDDRTTLRLSDEQVEERRMREALGLARGGSAVGRPRQDTSRKPACTAELVVAAAGSKRSTDMLNGLRQRLSAAESALQTERGERAAVQRALAEAQATIHQLQTKLAHAEIGAAEALEAERRALADVRGELEVMAASQQKPADTQPIAKKRGRPASVRVAEATLKTAEPKPVKWWLPDYRAKTKR